MLQTSNAQADLDKLCAIARSAGDLIMPIYRAAEIDVTHKDDDGYVSPLTQADTAAHNYISEQLQAAYPDIPILSEEGQDMDYETRNSWSEYWLVDPLDGTKEFIKKRDEFTVNIALIQNRQPVLGVVYAPAIDTMYYGAVELGAWKQADDTKQQLPIQSHANTPPVVVVSKSHFTQETQQFLDKVGDYQSLSVGSSLKLCMVAEGTADLYPRLGPTMEWDVGAGDAVVRSSGGNVVTYPDNQVFIYSKPDLRNGHFLAYSKATNLNDFDIING